MEPILESGHEHLEKNPRKCNEEPQLKQVKGNWKLLYEERLILIKPHVILDDYEET